MRRVAPGLSVHPSRIVRDDRHLSKRVVVLSGGRSLDYIETPEVLVRWTGMPAPSGKPERKIVMASGALDWANELAARELPKARAAAEEKIASVFAEALATVGTNPGRQVDTEWLHDRYVTDGWTIQQVANALECDYAEARQVLIDSDIPLGRTPTRRVGPRRPSRIQGRNAPPLRSYASAHGRVHRERGHASGYRCVECGECAHEWAYDHADRRALTERVGGVRLLYSMDIAHYQPMCRGCHRRFDRKIAKTREAVM